MCCSSFRRAKPLHFHEVRHTWLKEAPSLPRCTTRPAPAALSTTGLRSTYGTCVATMWPPRSALQSPAYIQIVRSGSSSRRPSHNLRTGVQRQSTPACLRVQRWAPQPCRGRATRAAPASLSAAFSTGPPVDSLAPSYRVHRKVEPQFNLLPQLPRRVRRPLAGALPPSPRLYGSIRSDSFSLQLAVATPQ